MTIKNLSESDIRAKYITPAVIQAGWDEATQIRREVFFTKGRIIVRGKLVTRGKAKKADYVLYYQHLPIALIEAKDNNCAVGDGMQQALDYAFTLDIPFVFASNGDGFVFHDRTGLSSEVETTIALHSFPSPSMLWAQYSRWKGLASDQEKIVLQPYYDDGSGKEPRYYQRNAINATVEAISKGQNRILLVMATGTGKTYTAFQIIWRLWKAKVKKRILFLADRNVLIDQTMVNDFRPFGGVMAKLSTAAKTIERDDGNVEIIKTAVDKHRRIDPSYEVYLGLYQAITGPEEWQKLFREFSPGFFDLIVIDECHRGSAAEDSAWREILEHFSTATQIGLTATPKETEYVSNIHYFGAPVYTYTLKQGIRDGFLAPYKVIKVHLDVDVEGYTASADHSINVVRLLRITDIQDNSVNWNSVPGCEIRRQQIEQFMLETGDILIARTGGTIGKSFLVSEVPVTAVFASYLIRVQKATALYGRYLKIFTESSIYWRQLDNGRRGSGQPNINGQALVPHLRGFEGFKRRISPWPPSAPVPTAGRPDPACCAPDRW